MVITIQCPKCGKRLWFSNKLEGTLTLCPACGGMMRLTAPPPTVPLPPPSLEAVPLPEIPPPTVSADTAAPQSYTPPAEAAAQPPAETPAQTPAAEAPAPEPDEDENLHTVEETTLTHQAVAAVGEAHIENSADESAESAPAQETVTWMIAPPPPPPPGPPDWSPPPLSSLTVRQEYQPFVPAAGQLPPMVIRVPEPFPWRPVLIWTCGALALAGLVLGILYAVGRYNSGGNWEAENRDQILQLKQDAEQDMLAGRFKDAYTKYRNIDRLVGDHTIHSAYLKEEVDGARSEEAVVFQRISDQASPPKPSGGTDRPPAATEPGHVDVQPAPLAVKPATKPAPLVAPTPPPPPVVETSPGPDLPPHGPIAEIPLPPPGLTDEQIGDAITRASDYLLKQFNTNAELPSEVDYHEGMDSLAVYALLQAGLASGDKRLDQHAVWTKNAINAMKRYLFKREDHIQTYSHALRAAALAVYDRDEDRSTLDLDVNWLLKNQVHGAYTYTDQFTPENMYWDNSNSQYGLLGVWSGAEVGIFVKPTFWRDAKAHWDYSQLPDGTWSYSQADQTPRKSMTLAGIASLYVAQDYLSTPTVANQIGRPPFSPPLQKALDWLEEGDNSLVNLQREIYGSYTLYGLERVGLASGFKYFGKHDWFREMAPQVISMQMPDGSWGARNMPEVSDAIRDTSYYLLFLARGRNPILMNKLRYDGDWANRPRDAANLSRFASRELERPVNWQVVPDVPPTDWRDWADSDVLYMAGDRAPDLSDGTVNNLRQYILHGGLLLTQTDDPNGNFGPYVEQLGHRLFPQYDWTDLPADSTLLTCQYRIKDLKVPVRIISNGSRILMIYWPQDVAVHWEMRDEHNAQDLFRLGVNVGLYAAGKDMKNRVNVDPVAPSFAVTDNAAPLHIARLRYDGNWDPEPIAFDRAARWFHQKTSLDVRVDSTPLESVDTANPAIAHLTGTAHVQFTDAQVQAVRKYVNGGGVLLVDPCGMPGDFLDDVRDDLLARAFPEQRLEPIQADHPLLHADNNGMTDVTSTAIRPFTVTLPDYVSAYPEEFTSGRGHVVVLPIDLTSGLAGCDTWGIAGYTPAYSLPLFQNIVLWVWGGAKE